MSTPENSPEKSIIYFGDPMCSWCWGFAPVLQQVRETFADAAPVEFIVGGLHVGDTEPMSGDYKAEIRHHWESVNATTGAEFDYAFFDRQGFVLDTEPACRAAVTMRAIKPQAALDFYEAISRSFYCENKDTTDLATFRTLAAEVGADAGTFAAAFATDEMRETTLGDFQFAQQIGVTGFPTVVLRDGDDLTLLTAGYQPFARIAPIIADWLADSAAGGGT